MDLIKIGQYIAGKRKDMGMTQKQLAEKLGMSDKSVSKWERGVCLPDVSIYEDLCQILGITINEFMAGEDIAEENILQKSEENIIDVAKDSKSKQKRLKLIITVLAAILLSAFAGTLIWFKRPQNYVSRLYKNSTELNTAMTILGYSDAAIYKYKTTDRYQSMTLHLYEYRNGEFANHETWGRSFDDPLIVSPDSGTISIVPDYENDMIKIVIIDNRADGMSTTSGEVTLLEDAPEGLEYSRISSKIESKFSITYNEEQWLFTIGFKDENKIEDEAELSSDETEIVDDGTDVRIIGEEWMDYEYVYYFTIEFGKLVGGVTGCLEIK